MLRNRKLVYGLIIACVGVVLAIIVLGKAGLSAFADSRNPTGSWNVTVTVNDTPQKSVITFNTDNTLLMNTDSVITKGTWTKISNTEFSYQFDQPLHGGALRTTEQATFTNNGKNFEASGSRIYHSDFAENYTSPPDQSTVSAVLIENGGK